METILGNWDMFIELKKHIKHLESYNNLRLTCRKLRDIYTMNDRLPLYRNLIMMGKYRTKLDNFHCYLCGNITSRVDEKLKKYRIIDTNYYAPRDFQSLMCVACNAQYLMCVTCCNETYSITKNESMRVFDNNGMPRSPPAIRGEPCNEIMDDNYGNYHILRGRYENVRYLYKCTRCNNRYDLTNPIFYSWEYEE